MRIFEFFFLKLPKWVPNALWHTDLSLLPDDTLVILSTRKTSHSCPSYSPETSLQSLSHPCKDASLTYGLEVARRTKNSVVW